MYPEDTIKKIEKVESIDILDPMDVSHRLHQLAALEDRWYEGYGVAPSKKGLTEFEKLFYQHFDENLPLPAIFPTIEGNIQLEWQKKNQNIILEVNLQSFQAEYFYFDSLDDTIEEEFTYSLSGEDGWETLCKKIEEIFHE